jgi:hypothetical protein
MQEQQIQESEEDDHPDSLGISLNDKSNLNGEGISERYMEDVWKADHDSNHVHNIPCRFQCKDECNIYHELNSTYLRGTCPFTIKEDSELLWDSDENCYLWRDGKAILINSMMWDPLEFPSAEILMECALCGFTPDCENAYQTWRSFAHGNKDKCSELKQ